MKGRSRALRTQRPGPFLLLPWPSLPMPPVHHRPLLLPRRRPLRPRLPPRTHETRHRGAVHGSRCRCGMIRPTLESRCEHVSLGDDHTKSLNGQQSSARQCFHRGSRWSHVRRHNRSWCWQSASVVAGVWARGITAARSPSLTPERRGDGVAAIRRLVGTGGGNVGPQRLRHAAPVH